MEYTSPVGVRRCSVASSPNDALVLIIPDHAMPETRQMAGFVALFYSNRIQLAISVSKAALAIEQVIATFDFNLEIRGHTAIRAI
jgi:hypothetical protein